MKQVYQTRFSDHAKGGNCLAACLASILDLEIEEVPDFDMRNGSLDWRFFYSKWLLERGYYLVCVYPDENSGHSIIGFDDGNYVILGGPSPRGVAHAVVGRILLNEYEIVHDPHPSNAGLLRVTGVYLISPLML